MSNAFNEDSFMSHDRISEINDQGGMVLDMDAFDFNDISDDEGNFPEELRDSTYEEEAEPDEENFDDMEDDEFEDEASVNVAEALSKLDSLADDFELSFGETKVAKGELVKMINDRETINKTREAIDVFAGRLSQKEDILNLSFEVAKTETDKQLENIYAMLNHPDKWNTATDVAQLQRTRVMLEARKSELDVKKGEAQAAIAEQKQQASVFRLQKVVQEMGGNGPLNEAAKFAESKGIDMEVLINGASPALVLALQNAAKYEALVSKNKAKLEAAAAEKKARSTPVKGRAVPKNSPSTAKRAQQLFDQGKLSHSDMFKFLTD